MMATDDHCIMVNIVVTMGMRMVVTGWWWLWQLMLSDDDDDRGSDVSGGEIIIVIMKGITINYMVDSFYFYREIERK